MIDTAMSPALGIALGALLGLVGCALIYVLARFLNTDD